MLHVVCVATKSEQYYPILQESCLRNNITLNTLGYGEEWQGFAWKFYHMMNFIKDLPDNDIVMFIDAYDVIILKDYNTILERFKSYNTAILLSVDATPTSWLHKLIYRKIFKKCGDMYTNAGTYMGYSYALKKMLDILCSKFDCKEFTLDDQVMLASICEERDFFNQYIKFDTEKSIFFNIFPKHLFTLNNDIEIKNDYITNEYNIEPCVIHGPGNTNLHKIVEAYKYNTQFIPEYSVWKSVKKRIPLYMQFFYYELFIVILVLIIVINRKRTSM